MEFFGRLNYGKFDMYKLKSNFPDHIISILIRLYEIEFDTGLLKNEVKVLYGSDDIKGNPLTKFCSGYMAAVWPLPLNKHTN